MDRTNIFASHDDRAIMGWFDYQAARAEWTDLDFNGNGSLGTGRGTGIILTAGGKWVSSRLTCWQGEAPTFAYVTAQDAREWLIANGEDAAVAEHFGGLAAEEDRRPGRPEIGGRITTALGDDLLAGVDAYAGEYRIARAEAVRRLVSSGLAVATGNPQ